MRIAVAGGTGTVGRFVVNELATAGHEPIVLSRSSGFDLVAGHGLTDVLAGCDAVVDVTSVSTSAAAASRDFFRTVTTNLLAAGAEAGVPHHLALSIVGAASVGAGYYAGKRLQEELVMAASGGWTIVRATQFHEFVHQVLHQGRVGPLQVVPTMMSQTVGAADVAAIIATLATSSPAGLTEDVAGPTVENMADLARRYLRVTGSRRPVLELSLPGA
jgi:uncharacterized protein YbjT (DUF2867 family)